MNDSFPDWLTKQMINGLTGFDLDAYMMALEGWRRGLILTWYYAAKEATDMQLIGMNPSEKIFSLYSQKNNEMYYFYRSRGSKVANEAVNIAQDRHLAKKYFQKAGVPTPNGVTFEKKLNEETVLQLVKHLKYPLVVKPTFGSLGKGVISNIQNEKELLIAVSIVRNNYEYDDIIVEKYQKGDEYRVYVVEDQVIAATKRIPPNVTGNGKKTIEQLISEKNETRIANPYLADKPIPMDAGMQSFLNKNGLSFSSVPTRGEKIFLKGVANISGGGVPVDVTENLSEPLKQLAVEAVQAIPGLTHAGVDIIVVKDRAVVIKVIATADIGMHVFPVEGKSQNVPAAIMDYYFNDTKGFDKRTKIYFDYHSANEILQKKLAQEITLTDAPNGELHMARYIAIGKVQKVGYRAWIRKQAVKRNLHGYTRNLENGRVVVIVGGADKKTVDDFRRVCQKGPARAKVQRVKQLEWEVPIKLGFEIRKSK